MKIKYLFISLLFFVSFAQARELTDLSLEVVSPKQGNEAKQDAFDRATEEATHRLTEELLGPERTAKVWATIRPKLLKNSTRYVVFIKGTPPVESGGQSKVQVQMRLSSDNLEAMLRELGVTGQSTVRVLPLVLVTEPKGTRFAWWADMADDKTQTFAKELFKKFYDQMAVKFKGKNVYVLDPNNASFRMSVPAAYRTEGLRREDQILLAQYLKADVVVSGRMDVSRADGSGSRIGYDLEMWQARSGRSLAEAQRLENVVSQAPKVLAQAVGESGAKISSDLAGKLNETLMNGSLNLNVVRLAVEGNLSFRHHADIRKMLGSLRDIKLIRERLFEPSRVTYEIETASTVNDLARSISKAQFPQYRVEAGSLQDDSLVLSVKSLAPPSAQ